MKSWCITLGALSAAFLLVSCGDIDRGDDGDGPYESIQLYVGDVPTDLVSIDWSLRDDAGTLLASGTVGPPLESNQTVARYNGVPRANMYMQIEPFLTGGTSCGVVETPRFDSSDPDVVFVVSCGEGREEFSALIIIGDLAPAMINDGLPSGDDYGIPDSYEETVTYNAWVVDPSIADYSLLLTWNTDLTRTWLLNTGTGQFGAGHYLYESITGRVTFLDQSFGPCAEYDYDVTVGALDDLPRVLSLELVSDNDLCHLGTIDISGVWTSATPL